MFTFEKTERFSAFIHQKKIGIVTDWPNVSVCLLEYDIQWYSDTLFNQLSIPFPKSLMPAVAKRRADYLSGRYAASLLLKQSGCHEVVLTGTDRAPVWPVGWRGSISHTGKWAIAVLTSDQSNLYLGVDIEELRPEVMLEIAPAFTIEEERALLAGSGLPFETALAIVFSAKESLFKALYPQVRHLFGFEAARLCEFNQQENRFTFELTRDLTPTLSVGYHAAGNYIFNKSEVTTLIIEVPRQNSPLSASFVL